MRCNHGIQQDKPLGGCSLALRGRSGKSSDEGHWEPNPGGLTIRMCLSLYSVFGRFLLSSRLRVGTTPDLL